MTLGTNDVQPAKIAGVVGKRDAVQGAVPRLVELGQTLLFGHALGFFRLDEFDTIFLNPLAHDRQTVGRHVIGSITGVTAGKMAPDSGKNGLVVVGRTDIFGGHVAFLPVVDQCLSGERLQFDVGATARHVGGDGDGPKVPRRSHDVGFALVVASVQDFVPNVVLLRQHLRQHFTLLNTGGSDQDGTPQVVECSDFIHQAFVLVLGLHVDHVVAILTRNGQVGGDHHHIEGIDLVELGGLGVGGTGHPCETVVHLEEVLDGDRGHGLGFWLDRHPLLGLDRLVQTVRPLATNHLSTGVLVHDDHARLAIPWIGHHHVIAIKDIHGVGPNGLLEQVGHVRVGLLVEGADLGFTLGFLNTGGRGLDLLLVFFDFVVLGELVSGGFEFGQLLFRGRKLRFHRLGGLGIDRVLDLPFETRNTFHTLPHFVVGLGPLALLLHEMASQTIGQFVPGLAVVGRSRNDQWGSRLINQGRVHFVHNRKLSGLGELHFLARLHVVPQVIKAELTGGAVHHVAAIRRTLQLEGLFVLGVNGPDRHTKRPEEGERPVAVALHEVIVDGDHVHLVAFQDCPVRREGRNDGLALTGFHLGDLAFGKDHGPDDLHVEGTRTERWL